MKKNLLFLCLLFATHTKAQPFRLTVFGGFGNYQGDLQDKRFTTTQSHAAFGIGVLYELTDNLSARANVTFGTISGDDKRNTKNVSRNLNFTSPITDIHLGAEYDVFSLYNKRFTPYAFAGISYFSFNPYTKDNAGNKVYLQPLGTEGQGFYQGRKKYKLSQIAIPFGGGVKFALSDKVRIGFEVGMRKTLSDYLDDVSTTFVDETTLLTFNGPKAVQFAFRGDELNPPLTYPVDGYQRGTANKKDWYYFSGITFSFSFKGKDEYPSAGNSKKNLGCPKAF